MPHSSGGGSHGGGSHGGSHGGGGGGGSSSSTRSSYFLGARHRYVYYRRGRPYYAYSVYDENDFKKSLKGQTIGSIISFIFLIPFVAAPLGIFSSVLPAKPLKMDYSKTEIVIEDTVDVIDNEDELYASLEAFQEKTGITPYIYTITNEEWKDHHSSLENYAYEYYVNEFEDESHWLLVYSTSEPDEGGYVDWYWEGMQGDDTDKILNSGITNAFNDELHKNFLIKNVGVGESFVKAFNSINPKLMKVSGAGSAIFFILFWYVFVGLFIFTIISGMIKNKHLKNATEVDMATSEYEAKQMESRCTSCGGAYVPSFSTRVCPHCGATVPVFQKKEPVTQSNTDWSTPSWTTSDYSTQSSSSIDDEIDSFSSSQSPFKPISSNYDDDEDRPRSPFKRYDDDE